MCTRFVLLLSEGAIQQPRYDREVASLLVGWEDDRVFVLGSGFGGSHGKRDRVKRYAEGKGMYVSWILGRG